jgi:hypothetical protein
MNLNHRSFLIILVILCAIFINAGESLALTPIIDSITPDSAPNTSVTDVTIRGSNFVQDARVSLFPGGLYIKAYVDTPGEAFGLYISGRYAYVADGSAGFTVIDISNPDSPIIIGSVDTPDSAVDVYVSGNYAYVADYFSGLQVIDISTLSNPVIVGSVATPDRAVGVYVSGNYAYVADGNLHVIDISTPSSPKIIGSVIKTGGMIDLDISGNYAYVANFLGLDVIDISTPSSPKIIGSVEIPDHDADNVSVSGNYAYVLTGAGDLYVIDISTPSSPTVIRSSHVPSSLDAYFSGGYLYVSGAGLGVIDISTLSNPAIIGSIDTGSGWDVYVSGIYAYVTGALGLQVSGLQVIDISTPSNPVIVGTVATPRQAIDVYVSGNYAYVADGNLRVIDISIPSSPAIIGSIEPVAGDKYKLGLAFDVYVSGNYAYVAADDIGLQVIDISTPSNPVIVVDPVNTPYPANGLYVSNNYVYMVEGSVGRFEVIMRPLILDSDIEDSTTITATIPPNLPEGSYHVIVTNPGTEVGRLYNGFRVVGNGIVDGIVDNIDPGFSVIGTWHTSTLAPNFYGIDFLYAGSPTGGTGSNQAIWDPELTAGPGAYEVFGNIYTKSLLSA